MASTKTKQEKQQRLGDLLRQEQEPFVLDQYLFERGCFKKNSFSNSPKQQSCRFIGYCCNGNNSKSYFSKTLRAVLNKFTSHCEYDHNKREAKFTSVNYEKNNGQQVCEAYQRESFSSENVSVTVLNSCSESYKLEELSPTSSDEHYDSVETDTLEGLGLSNMTEEEAYAGRDFQCQFMPKYNQLSPISVLEQSQEQSKLGFRTSQGKESQTTCTVRLPSKLGVEDSAKLSASVCKLNFESISDKSIRNNGGIINDDDPMKLFGSNKSLSPQILKSMRMLQQTKQLLFDCVREIISENVEKCHKGLVETEELGNLLLERMKAWDNIEIGNGSQTLASAKSCLDIFDQEWKNGVDFEKREICFEIGDSIAEDFVNEIVVEFQQ